MSVKKIPLRKCTGCQELISKKELIRIVRNDDNSFSIDYTSKKSGRGAYICNNIKCFEKAQKSRGLERSFKVFVPKNVYEDLRKELEFYEV